MSILVTGGTGALGYHILSSLCGTSHDLYSFSDEQPQPWQKVEGATYLNGDLLNSKGINCPSPVALVDDRSTEGEFDTLVGDETCVLLAVVET